MDGQPLPSLLSTEEEIHADDEGVGQNLVSSPPHGAATQHDAQIGENETENGTTNNGVDEIAVEAVGGENSNSAKKIPNKPVDMKNGEPVIKYYTLQQRGNLVVFGPPLRSSSSEPESDTHPPRTTGATADQLQAANSVTSRKRSLRKTLNPPRSWPPSHGDATSKDSTTDSDVDTTSDSDQDEEGAGAGKIHGESPPVIKRGRGRKKVKSSDDGVGVGTPSPAVQVSNQPRQRRYECVSCDKSYNAITDLRNHRLNYHRLDESRFPFSCKVAACERRFETKNEMKNHKQYAHPKGSTEMFTQDEDEKKSFKCDQCRRTFKSKSTLTFHKSKVHSAAGLAQFACAHCNNKYCSKSGLTKHVLKQHAV